MLSGLVTRFERIASHIPERRIDWESTLYQVVTERRFAHSYPRGITRTRGDDANVPMAKVEFGGILKETCLAYTPEAQVGDYVLIHVGFALSRIDEQEAQEIFSYLEEIGAERTDA